MSVAVVNSSTVTEFVDDTATFDCFVREWFAMVDQNGDGKLSRDEIRGGLGMLLSLGSESQPQQDIDSVLELIFKRFDEDRKGALVLKEFKSLMKDIMHAVARGIGGSPIIVALDKHSLLMKAAQRELATRSSPP
ncbi:respiratory burst oxidase homolog protein C-like [Gastrolobium bilobum]|uniref:respiratory burst oxidase homolog protein C-like n=1 Tax=Gastrolobium bilobum TaxID=150636 RepID=UPI002AAFFCF3|nr:respiratory burst oxidase homolog protein C-like [Gastrolobium bilobum]